MRRMVDFFLAVVAQWLHSEHWEMCSVR